MMEVNKIYCCDCLDLLKSMDDGCCDLLLQDMPYGVTQNNWDVMPNLDVMWKEWIRVGKSNAAYIFTGTQPFVSDLIESNRAMFRYDLIWYKALGTGFLNANKMPMRNHEHILIFYQKLPTYNPQKTIGKMRLKGSKNPNTSPNYGDFVGVESVNDSYYPQSVLDFTNGDRTIENEHPTQKPLLLFRYLVATYSNENDLVFDGYVGSGTTAIAATMEKRNFICSEISHEYHEQSQQRLELLLSQPMLF